MVGPVATILSTIITESATKVGFDRLATLKTLDRRNAIYQAFEPQASRVLERLTLKINDVDWALRGYELAKYQGSSQGGQKVKKPEFGYDERQEELMEEMELLLKQYCMCFSNTTSPPLNNGAN